MEPGRLSPVRRLPWVALAALALLSGCHSADKRRDPPPAPPDYPINAAEIYSLACPDVVEVQFIDRPDLVDLVKIEPDGCLHFGALGTIRVEGDTPAEAAARIAERLGVPSHKVRLQVVDYNSRQVFLFGQVNDGPRAVEYRGPETVVELLERAGGLSPDAAPNEIYIVRAGLGEGIPAEVMTVDLDAIQNHDDQRTNVRVQPLDEIYVGEKVRSRISKVVPTFLKPIYASIMAMFPQRTPRPDPEQPKPAK